VGEKEEEEERPKKPSRLPVSHSWHGLVRECYPEDLRSEEELENSSEDDGSGNDEEMGDGIPHYKKEIRKMIHTSEIEYMIRDKWPEFFTKGHFELPDSPELCAAVAKIRGILEMHYGTILKDTHDFLVGAMGEMEKELDGPINALTELVEKENAPLESAHIEKVKARKLKALERKRKKLEEKEKQVNDLGSKNGKSKRHGKKKKQRAESGSESSDDSDSSYSEKD
jgi:hypothetical protein